MLNDMEGKLQVNSEIVLWIDTAIETLFLWNRVSTFLEVGEHRLNKIKKNILI